VLLCLLRSHLTYLSRHNVVVILRYQIMVQLRLLLTLNLLRVEPLLDIFHRGRVPLYFQLHIVPHSLFVFFIWNKEQKQMVKIFNNAQQSSSSLLNTFPFDLTR
jgi:hypothetical protein